MNTDNIRIPAADGSFLDGRVYYPETSPVGVMVYSHGLFSSKDAYKINTMAEDLAHAGYAVITFSYGYTRDYRTGRPLDISLEDTVPDLETVCTWAVGNFSAPLHLFGSSMGGAAALWFAAGTGIPLNSISLMATPVDLANLVMLLTGGRPVEELPDDGAIPAGEFPITNASLKKLVSVDLAGTLHRIKSPVLILHGEKDEVVAPKNASIIAENTGGEKKLYIINNGDHGLTAPQHLEVIREQVLSWLQRYS